MWGALDTTLCGLNIFQGLQSNKPYLNGNNWIHKLVMELNKDIHFIITNLTFRHLPQGTLLQVFKESRNLKSAPHWLLYLFCLHNHNISSLQVGEIFRGKVLYIFPGDNRTVRFPRQHQSCAAFKIGQAIGVPKRIESWSRIPGNMLIPIRGFRSSWGALRINLKALHVHWQAPFRQIFYHCVVLTQALVEDLPTVVPKHSSIPSIHPGKKPYAPLDGLLRTSSHPVHSATGLCKHPVVVHVLQRSSPHLKLHLLGHVSIHYGHRVFLA